MSTNDILARIYSLYPAIGAWARAGKPGIWINSKTAKLEVAHYLGPSAHPDVIDCYHIRHPDDVDFVTSIEAYNAICLVIDAVYSYTPPSQGLFDT